MFELWQSDLAPIAGIFRNFRAIEGIVGQLCFDHQLQKRSDEDDLFNMVEFNKRVAEDPIAQSQQT